MGRDRACLLQSCNTYTTWIVRANHIRAVFHTSARLYSHQHSAHPSTLTAHNSEQLAGGTFEIHVAGNLDG